MEMSTPMYKRQRMLAGEEGEIEDDPGVYAGGSALGDYSVGKRVVWRPGSFSRKKGKLLERQFGRFICTWGRLSQHILPITTGNLPTAQGANVPSWTSVRSFQLKHQAQTNGATGAAGTVQTRELPLHIFDLCQRHTYIDAPADKERAFGYFLKDVGSNIEWGELTAANDGGTVGTSDVTLKVPWLYYSSQGPEFQLRQLPVTVIDKVVVDLTMQGMRNNPCTYFVKLVQFTEAGLEPHAASNDMRINWWRRFTHRLISHPDARLAPMERQVGDGTMKVLKSWKYYFAPSQTTEQMIAPSIRRERLVINLNRKCNWRHQTELANMNKIDVDKAEDENVTLRYMGSEEDADRNFLPDVRARVYLMIYATNPAEVKLGAAETCTYDPQAGTVSWNGAVQPLAISANCPQYDARFYIHHSYVMKDNI